MQPKLLIFTCTAILAPALCFAQVVNLNNGVQMVASKNIALVIDNGGMKNDGVFVPDSSTVYFDGGASTVLSGTQTTNFFNLTARGTGIKANTGTAAIWNTLAAQGSTTLDADGPGNNSLFTLKSVAASTANVAVIPATANITGNVIVERYIHTPRKWQLLAVPTASTQTIRQAWQENGAAPAGYGTAITGPTGTSLDFTSPLYSMKYVNTGGTDFTVINNTNDLISAQKDGAYYIYVRGDRTDLTSNQNNNTTLRSIGPLNVHNFTPTVTIPANTFKSVGNPYASAIHFHKIYAHSNIDNEFQLWDPKMPGYYTAGGFVAFSASTYEPYDPVPLSAGEFQFGSFPANTPNTRIESGQGFYVYKTGAAGAISFVETDKGDSSRSVNRGGEESREPVAGRSQFNARFYGVLNNNAVLVDGNATVFGAEFSSNYDDRDVDKMTNGSDNFGIDDKQSHELIIDTRPAVAERDTIHFAMYDPFYEQYKIKFNAQNFAPSFGAWLIDKYTHTETPIGLLGDTTEYSFVVNATPASYASDRFKVVFKKLVAVPVRFISIQAQRNADRSITVSWNIANEVNIDHYELERSPSSTAFNEIGETNATNSSQYSKIDMQPLSGDNYYRVKAIDISGEFLYSGIVKVAPDKGLPTILVVNPVKDKGIQIKFENQLPGKYNAQLFNDLGQLIINETILIQTNAELKTISLDKKVAMGAYQLTIRNAENKLMHTQTLLIE
jgi:hypothetical protein